MKRFFVILTVFLLFFVFTARILAAGDAFAADRCELLSAYIGGCEQARDISSMVAVGAVILNRCNGSSFPDTISANGASLGILPVSSPSPMARYAARLALSGLDPTSGAISFFPADESASHVNEYVTYSASGLSFVK